MISMRHYRMSRGLAGLVTAITILSILIPTGHSQSNSERPWLARRWQRAIDRIQEARRTFSVLHGEWKPYDLQPLSCEHLRFRTSEYARLVAEVRRSVEAFNAGSQSAGTSGELSRLLARMMVSLENYSAPMGEIVATLPALTSDVRWVIIRYDNMVEVAPLRGVQIVGSNFKLEGDELQSRIVVPFNAVCQSNLVEVYVFGNCVSEDDYLATACTIQENAWQVIKVNLPLAGTRSVWQ